MSGPERRSLRSRRGEIVALEGPVGLRQDDAAVDPRLHPHADLRPGRRRRRGDRPGGPARLPEIRKQSIGFVFQQFNLFPALTALENVEYALNIKGDRRARPRSGRPSACSTRSASSTAAASCRATSRADRSSASRSPARSPASPPILLADEPTANLDSQIGGQILELFRALAKKENRGLLIVTHDPKVRTIADRVLQIRDGLVAADGLMRATSSNRRNRKSIAGGGDEELLEPRPLAVLGLGLLAVVALQARAAGHVRRRPQDAPRRRRAGPAGRSGRRRRPRAGWSPIPAPRSWSEPIWRARS